MLSELSRIRIAVIEDDPSALETLKGAVSQCEDMTIVSVAHNVSTGKVLVDKGGFDVLLCDLGLPDGSGVTLIRQAAQKYKACDILVITIFADQGKVLESIRAGARGYLLKDERFDQCAESIREIRRGGSPISPIIARQLLKEFQPKEPDKSFEALSKREMEVLSLLARGFSFNEIGDILKISRSTVATYVKFIYQKLEVNSRSEAVFEAMSLGIIEAPR